MGEATTHDVVHGYHRAWTSKNFDEAGRYLARDLETDVPINSYRTTDEFVEALSAFGRLVERVDLLAELADGDKAMLIYDLVVEPIGTLRIAEHFTIAHGHIARIRHVHDTVALRAAGFAQ